jgi:hypothetical protein
MDRGCGTGVDVSFTPSYPIFSFIETSTALKSPVTTTLKAELEPLPSRIPDHPPITLHRILLSSLTPSLSFGMSKTAPGYLGSEYSVAATWLVSRNCYNDWVLITLHTLTLVGLSF